MTSIFVINSFSSLFSSARKLSLLVVNILRLDGAAVEYDRVGHNGFDSHIPGNVKGAVDGVSARLKHEVVADPRIGRDFEVRCELIGRAYKAHVGRIRRQGGR